MAELAVVSIGIFSSVVSFDGTSWQGTLIRNEVSKNRVATNKTDVTIIYRSGKRLNAWNTAMSMHKPAGLCSMLPVA